MKKYFLSLVVLLLIGSVVYLGVQTAAQKLEPLTDAAPINEVVYEPDVSQTIVISQVQGGGGVAEDEFVEIHNVSSSPFDLNGHKLVYRSSSGTSDVGPLAQWTTTTIIPAGGFYLVAATNYDGPVEENFTYSPAACACSISATSGGVALRNTATNVIIDSVGYGTTTNAFVETSPAPSPGNNNSTARKQNGCQDTDNNANDFAVITGAAPRNLASAPVACSSTGSTTIFSTISASPATVSPNGTTLITVSVQPAANPASTGITVFGNLSSVGGSANQPFYDNGTNGDVTAGDNVFSYTHTIPAAQTGGTFSVSAQVSDVQNRTSSSSTNISVNAQLPNEDPLLFGNPSYATANVAFENNYLMIKPQYTLSYNRSRNEANWVAWRLDTSWIGSTGRVGDFAPDTTLPAGWYQVTPDDYTDNRFDRGHMTPSGDRTTTFENNQATFLMTNILPQAEANNQGPWADLEVYSRTLAQSGNELYIISGGVGNIGTVGATANRVVIPEFTWKVVLVLPNGSDDLRRVTRTTRMFGVIMSNVPGAVTIGTPWRNFRVTVDQLEALTGYNFFSEIPINTQAYLERKRDTQ